tara:strand:+ start:1488 stop:1943 length:456 start_codon:yes stop_codon:yes gene_type:complete
MDLINKKYNKYLIIILIFIILDQFTKFIVSTNYDYLLNKNLLIFSFKYIRNYGAAFNFLNNKRIFLSTISTLSSLLLIYFIFFKESINSLNRYGLSFILAGSIGNGIDRIIKGYVIDFINLEIFDFPIFNIADISINFGCIILIINYLKNK